MFFSAFANTPILVRNYFSDIIISLSKKLKNEKPILFFTICSVLAAGNSKAQNQFPNIDPKWETYYNQHPSGIEEHHQASDFIAIIEVVGFVPASTIFKKDTDLFKKQLLKLEQDDLNQLKITGKYYSRTYKHDDYFYLYNLTYNKVTKDEWDKYCPYLIPLMELDQIIKLH